MEKHKGPHYYQHDGHHKKEDDTPTSIYSEDWTERNVRISDYESKIYHVPNVGMFPKRRSTKPRRDKFGEIRDVGLRSVELIDHRKFGLEKMARRLPLGKCNRVQHRACAGGVKEAPVDKLPNELLDFIFSFLDIRQRIGIELVCKRWRFVGKYVTWSEPKRLIFDPWNRSVNPTKQKWTLTNDNFEAILSRCGPSVRQLTLVRSDRPKRNPSYRVVITEDSVKVIARYCPNLEDIKLKYLKLRRKHLLRLAQGCSKLKTVIFSKFGTTDEGFSVFYEACKTLESLTLDPDHKKVLRCDLHNDGVNGESFDIINPHLLVLNLFSCDNLQQFAFACMISTFDRLQELRLNVCYPEKVESQLLLNVVCHFRNTLKLLDLSLPLKPFNWCEAMQALHKLEELYLHTQGIVLDCPCYRRKACFNQVSPHLKILDVSETSPLNSNNEEYIITKFFTSCDSFEELYLTRSNLSPQTLSLVAKYADTLKVLDLSRFKSLNCNWCNFFPALHNLETLKVTNCNEINDDVARVWSQDCISIRVLHVCSSDLTDEGLTYLASLPYLAVLDVSDCGKISDDGIQVLAAHGRLEELYAATSSNIFTDVSDVGCCSLAMFCPQLRLLDVSNVMGTGKITDNLVASFRESVLEGFLKHGVELLVGGTVVHEGVETCEGLSVLFNFYYSFNAIVTDTMDALHVFTAYPNG